MSLGKLRRPAAVVSCFVLFALLLVPPSLAQELQISLGIRETGGMGPIGADGGSSGSIEWVDFDANTLVANGTWQTFTFTPAATGALTGFTGDGILDVEWATLEHLRIKNTADGATQYAVYIDDIINTDSMGATTVADFEGFAVGDEVVFQEPGFSGSSVGVDGGTAGVTDSMANNGSQSYAVDVNFVDDSDANWLRLTTFNSANVPNPLLHVNESLALPSVSITLKADVVPEPASGFAALVMLGLVGLLRRRR